MATKTDTVLGALVIDETVLPIARVYIRDSQFHVVTQPKPGPWSVEEGQQMRIHGDDGSLVVLSVCLVSHSCPPGQASAIDQPIEFTDKLTEEAIAYGYTN
jgi:hypothetical protein